MKTLNQTALSALLDGSSTIEEDGYGLKVARLEDGNFIKLYRRKRLLSSALLIAPAERFARNARQLLSLGISAPTVVDTLKVPSLGLNGLIYRPLPGENLRTRWRALDDAQRAPEVERFGYFLGEIHGLGIYFRSLHLGNVLMLPDEKFGLIDLSDMRISSRPLAINKRRRNINHMLRYEEDSRWLAGLHRQSLLRGYACQAGQDAARHLSHALEKASQVA